MYSLVATNVWLLYANYIFYRQYDLGLQVLKRHGKSPCVWSQYHDSSRLPFRVVWLPQCIY